MVEHGTEFAVENLGQKAVENLGQKKNLGQKVISCI